MEEIKDDTTNAKLSHAHRLQRFGLPFFTYKKELDLMTANDSFSNDLCFICIQIALQS